MKRFVIGFAVLVTLAACAFAAWRLFPPAQTFFTDAGAIRESAATALVRDVLWEPPVPLAPLINAVGETYEPRLSNDAGTLYFVRGKAGGNADIYFARRTAEGWSEPEPLAEINSDGDDLGPEVSADGASIYFYSNRPGGHGGYDLWVSRRGTDGAWRGADNLGPQVNSQFNDYGPALTADGGTLYFSSNRPLPGDDRQPDPTAWQATLREEFFTRTYDLYSAALTESGAGKAEPLSVLNTPGNEGAPAVSSFGDFLYFASDRTGGSGGFDLYRARRIRNVLQAPTNLGSAVNTSDNELDPALSMNGFGLDFSSNRPSAGAAPDAPREYKLYHTNSREVFSETQTFDRPPIDWAALWRAMGPNLLWALLALALLLTMLLLFKGGRNRKLNLLTKCVLASLAAHLLLMLLFNVWEVAASVAGEIRGSGGGGAIRVALSPSGGGGITAQLGGSLSEIAAPQVRLNSIRAAGPAEFLSPAAHVDIPLQKAALEIASGSAVQVRAEEATTESPSPTVPDVAPNVDASQPHAIALNVPSAPSSTPTAEAAVQIGAAPTSIARQQSSLNIPSESGAFASPGAPTRTQLPASKGLTQAGLSGIARESETTNFSVGGGATDLPALPPASAYRVTLAADFPEAPMSAGPASESRGAIPVAGIAGVARQAVVDRIEGVPTGNSSVGSPIPGRANLAGIGSAKSAPGLSLAPSDSIAPPGRGGQASAGSGDLESGSISAMLANGNASKGFASVDLALPAPGAASSGSSTASANRSEAGRPVPAPSIAASSTRAALSIEILGSPTGALSKEGGGSPRLPRADVLATAGPPSGPGSANGTKAGASGDTIARDASLKVFEMKAGSPTIHAPTTGSPAFALSLPSELAPPEESLALEKPAGVDNDSPDPDEIIGTIRGTVTNKATGEPLGLAQVRLVLADRDTLTATTDSDGKYTLAIPQTPDFFAMSTSLDGFVPRTRSIERARLEGKKKLIVNFALEPESLSAAVTETTPDVHHLGDDRFSGSINSQFQKKSQGAKFATSFEISAESLANPLGRAEVRLMAKGVQRRHKVFVNDTLLTRRLDEAPEDGGFGEFVAPFDPALLAVGTNRLRIEALPSTEDIDDFEFVNIRVYLIAATGPVASPTPPADAAGTQ